MHIQANITLVEGDTLPGTPAECAAKILTALGGDDTKDICNVVMNSTGSAGNIPAPMPPPTSPPA